MKKQILVDGVRVDLEEWKKKQEKPVESKAKNEPVYEEDLSLDSDVNLNNLRVADLKAIAKKENLEVEGLKKQEIIELLEEARSVEL